MSEIITFNTEEIAKSGVHTPTQQVPLFDLVHEHHPILREVLPEFDFSNPPVNPNQFASSMVETCKMNHGIGLSANQCGFKYRMFVMGAGDEYVAFFNPKIISTNGESHMIEGCLSFPFLGLRITRPETIEVEYQDYNGEKKTTKLNGISARCFLHELDHMNGVLYVDRAKPLALQQGKKKREKLMRSLRIR
jgi:peptide deformylase